MENISFWWNVIFFLVVFLIIYIIIYCYNLRKIKKKKENTMLEYHYLISKFHLDPEILKARKVILVISIIDAFIISFVTTFLSVVELSIFWQIMIGFVLLVSLIYACYEIYGRYLVKKGFQKKIKERKKKK